MYKTEFAPQQILFKNKTEFAPQQVLFESGNELAAYAAKQINYHVMGYYPITPSTQIAENLDVMGAEGEHDIMLIAAEGEHSARRDLLRRCRRRRQGHQCHQRQRAFVCLRTAPGTVRHPDAHGVKRGMPYYLRPVKYQRRPQRPDVSVEHRMGHSFCRHAADGL